MARLSKHGGEIGRIEFTTFAKAYLANGTILKNQGFGWKMHGKVKPDHTPAEAFAAAAERQKAFLAANPCYAAYLRELHDLAPLSKRWKLQEALEVMPGDPDGVWSEVCDSYSDNVSASIDEIVKLADLYSAAVNEAKARKD